MTRIMTRRPRQKTTRMMRRAGGAERLQAEGSGRRVASGKGGMPVGEGGDSGPEPHPRTRMRAGGPGWRRVCHPPPPTHPVGEGRAPAGRGVPPTGTTGLQGQPATRMNRALWARMPARRAGCRRAGGRLGPGGTGRPESPATPARGRCAARRLIMTRMMAGMMADNDPGDGWDDDSDIYWRGGRRRPGSRRRRGPGLRRNDGWLGY